VPVCTRKDVAHTEEFTVQRLTARLSTPATGRDQDALGDGLQYSARHVLPTAAHHPVRHSTHCKLQRLVSSQLHVLYGIAPSRGSLIASACTSYPSTPA
jgi:hypothetical protein